MKETLKRFPFDPGRWPFFYGWAILIFGTLGMLMSIPGQTVGVSVFTDYLIDALRISRQYLSLAYLIGTISSAFLLTRAGKLYDRYGARRMGVTVSMLLGAVLLFLSFSPVLTTGFRRLLPFSNGMVAPFIIMSLGFFLLRFFGQGALTMVSRNVVMEWFEKRRGMANSILGVAVAFGFSYAPRLLDDLINIDGWRWAWRGMGIFVGAGFAILAFIFFRDKPEDHGLIPDGKELHDTRKNHPETSAARQFTLPEARKTLTFWAFSISLLLSATIVTAFTFHVVSIFTTVGLSRAQAVAIFFPSSIVAVCIQFAASWASDYIKLKYILMLHLAGMVLLLCGIIFLKSGPIVLLLIVGNGLANGLFSVNGNITWARFFGRKHLGAVTGFASALIVAGSAVGPYLFSLSLEWSGSYTGACIAIGIIIVLLLFVAVKAERPG